MRLFVSGSAPLLAETHQAFEQAHGQRILERYGMTETGMITSNPYDGERLAGHRWLSRCPASRCASPTPRARAVPRGDIGVIEVKGPNVFKGYWQMPDKTAAEFRPDGYFITGDLGHHGRRRPRHHRRARQGPDHLRRLQRLSQGDRGGDSTLLSGIGESAP